MASKIQSEKWWDKSITLVEGCSPVSAGCAHCWSAGMTHRFHQGKGLTTNSHFNGKIICREDRLDEILRRKKPTRWVIWNDLFNEKVPFEFIDKVLLTIYRSNLLGHIFQILTKRPKRMLEYFKGDVDARILKIYPNANSESRLTRGIPYPNLWLGVTCENQATADKRIPILLQIPAAVRFVSIEPMLGAIDLRKVNIDLPSRYNGVGHNYKEVDCLENSFYSDTPYLGAIGWVIVGAESGPGARYCPIENIRNIVEQCKAAGVPVFVKQIHMWETFDGRFWENEEWAELNRYNRKYKRVLVKDINRFPPDLRIREYPNA